MKKSIGLFLGITTGIVFVNSAEAINLSNNSLLNYTFEDVTATDDYFYTPYQEQNISSSQSVTATLKPLLTTFGNPADYVVNTPLFDAVADLRLSLNSGGFARCTGSLIGSDFLLTAAHCLTDLNGTPSVNGVQATFGNGEVLTGQSTFLAPFWTGNLLQGGDLAIIRTTTSALNLTPYEIFTDNPATLFNQAVDKVGVGRAGNGNQGSVLNSGTKRSGQNSYDAFGDLLLTALNAPFSFVSNSQLQYDFDNGNSANDAFGFFSRNNLGLGNNEVSAAPGDSGGPTFTPDGKIMGVTSYGLRLSSSDIDNILNSSFGEIAGDANVSLYTPWIQAVLNNDLGNFDTNNFGNNLTVISPPPEPNNNINSPNPQDPISVPEPHSILSIILTGFSLFISRKK
ncbi:MAG: S1 family peptidase [Cyanobacterium sp. T60_A2020_053]|nr:S1 family peptidase [Cyanobacterium sp. T60_A2020_053]